VRVSVDNATTGTPAYFLSTGEVKIDGILTVDGHEREAGPAGFDGGLGGAEASSGEGGYVAGGGEGGIVRHPGSGGGFATSGGATKKDGCLSEIFQGSVATPYDPDLFNGGSGGGGGALLISTPASITIGGYVKARGAGGGWCYTSALCGIRGGPGGGGAGGMVDIEADTVLLESDGLIDCRGGKGGVRSSDGSLTPFGGNGGYGYIVLHSPEWQKDSELCGKQTAKR